MAKDTSENKLSSEPISIDTAKPNLDNLGRAYATGRRKTPHKILKNKIRCKVSYNK